MIRDEDYPEGTPVVEAEENYVLPALYKTDANGTEQVWKVWVEGNVVKKTWGDVGGKMQLHERGYSGVNKGKKNETTDREQAMREAERDWIKYLDKEYRPKSKEGKKLADKVLKGKAKQCGVNVNIYSLIRGGDTEPDPVKTKKTAKKTTKAKKAKKNNHSLPGYEVSEYPMHAQLWEEVPKCLKYFDFEEGVWIQRKYDGIRCHARLVERDGELYAVFTSRKGKQFVWLNHLREQLKIFLEGYEDVVLDCELYADVIVDENGDEYPLEKRFDTISGACRSTRSDPHPQEEQISLFVFDLADASLNQDERFEKFDEMFGREEVCSLCPNIIGVEKRLITDQADISKAQDEFASEDYEGVIIRSRDNMYEFGKRSLKMRKYKEFVDEEFPIVGAKLDPGLTPKDFVWLCEAILSDGKKKIFRVKPTGSEAQKEEFYANYPEYVGFLLTCRYQKVQSETTTAVPRFGRGVALRDTDSETYIYRYEKKAAKKTKKAPAKKTAKSKTAKKTTKKKGN